MPGARGFGWFTLITAAALSCAHAAPSESAAAAVALTPGLYEMALRTRFDDAHTPVPTRIVQRCVTATEVATPTRLAPAFAGDTHCTTSAPTLEDQRASWTLACTGEPAMQGKATVAWQADSFEGATHLEMRRGSDRMRMTQSYTARRLGECK